MDKIVIVYNKHSKTSNDFVTANPTTQTIDCFGQDSNYHEYVAKDLPKVSKFPAVVDTELKLVSNNPETLQAGLDNITVLEDKKQDASREKKLRELRNQRNQKLKEEVDVMCNELSLGLRSDAANINTHRINLLNITNGYKDWETVQADKDALDTLDITTVSWPTPPTP
jgi:hypothetical protein